ncbi:MAG: hypothetical protein DRG78_10910 [Epsilonproteobacteria bacterium]|nr:MAG: hypothetical protein DRG78_10910 [Campylobacterota bacterium]
MRNQLVKAFLIVLLLLNILNATEDVPTEDEVIKLYVATFKRAPDKKGLDYWVSSSGLKLSQIAQSFFDQTETKDLYPDGTSTTEFINSIYSNLFNRVPDSIGLDYWKIELDEGRISKNRFIEAVINGAQGDDDLILENKTSVGRYFAITKGYSDITLAKTIMENITKDISTVNNAKAILDNISDNNIDLISYSFNIESSKILLGSSTIENSSGWGCVGKKDEDNIGNLYIIAQASNDGYCFVDGRYNFSNFNVEIGSTNSSIGGITLDTYKIHQPATAPTEFSSTKYLIYYKFPTYEDYTIYEFENGDFTKLGEVKQSSIIQDDYTKIDFLAVEDIKTPKSIIFAPSTTRVSIYNKKSDILEMARIKVSTKFDLYKYRYTPSENAIPFDNKRDFSYSLNTQSSIYSRKREYFSIINNQTLGVIWQDQNSANIFFSNFDATLNNYTQIKFPNNLSEQLAAATIDSSGNIYYITIQSGSGLANDSARSATIYKADHSGTLISSKSIDTSKSGLNIVEFDTGNVASLLHKSNQLALVIGRRMHRSSDGLNHQGAIAIVFDDSSLEVIKNFGQTSGHSWESVLKTNINGEFIAIDLGDNYPRGINFHKFTNTTMAHKLIYTFKTEHGTSDISPAGVKYDFYNEISNATTSYYKWSNDNKVYTEIGGLIQNSNGEYLVIFVGEPNSNGLSIDNSRVSGYLNDPRDIGFVKISSDLSIIQSTGIEENGGFYTFGGTWSNQNNRGVTWLVDYKDINLENATRLKTLRLSNGNIFLI